MGFWTFVLMILVAGVFGYFSKDWFNAGILFIFMCIFKLILSWIRDGTQ
jgi:hypothetical protein